MSKLEEKRHLKCSFCGKNQDQVRRLIAGPNVYICDECVELCDEIIQEEIVDNVEEEFSKLETFVQQMFEPIKVITPEEGELPFGMV